jgi:cytochrome c553
MASKKGTMMPVMKRLTAVIFGLAWGALAGTAGAGPLDNPGFAKSLTCSACHGAAGNSRSDSMPIIAGMDPAYFKKQMDAYATGKRPSPEMEPYAKMVLVLGVDQVAGYFAEQKTQPTPIAVDAAAAARGRVAAAQCVICHGQDGKGDAAKLIPSLTGQPPGYLREQMLMFKQDKRNPGDAALKAVKALMLTIPDATYVDLAAYYSSLR